VTASRTGFIVFDTVKKTYLSSKVSDPHGKWKYNISFKHAIVFKTERIASDKIIGDETKIVVPVDINMSEKDLFASILSGRGHGGDI
jgi:hypothetical protein